MGLGIRAKYRSFLNMVKAKCRLGRYWYWLSDDETGAGIPIAPLIFPLRYDILIRKEFFDLYEANRDLATRDRRAFLALATDHIYFKWFKEVLIARYNPDLMADPTRVADLFSRRVAESIELKESIRRDGFDISQPIIPFTGETILPADSGRTVSGRFFMGDGCHRLACLLSMGFEALPSSYFRVKCFDTLRPFDNTSILEGVVPVEWPKSFTEGKPA